MKISSKLYDFIKVLCPVLGALSAFYVALADVWSLPYATEISGTIGAVIALLGSVMSISSKTYWANTDVIEVRDPKEDGIE